MAEDLKFRLRFSYIKDKLINSSLPTLHTVTNEDNYGIYEQKINNDKSVNTITCFILFHPSKIKLYACVLALLERHLLIVSVWRLTNPHCTYDETSFQYSMPLELHLM